MSRIYNQDPPDLLAMIEELAASRSQADVARMVGVDSDTISNYRLGKRSNISFQIGWAICRAYHKHCR